jgi:hypothetical protein
VLREIFFERSQEFGARYIDRLGMQTERHIEDSRND